MVGPKYHCLLEQNLDMQENMKTDNCGRTCRTVIFKK